MAYERHFALCRRRTESLGPRRQAESLTYGCRSRPSPCDEGCLTKRVGARLIDQQAARNIQLAGALLKFVDPIRKIDATFPRNPRIILDRERVQVRSARCLRSGKPLGQIRFLPSTRIRNPITEGKPGIENTVEGVEPDAAVPLTLTGKGAQANL